MELAGILLGQICVMAVLSACGYLMARKQWVTLEGGRQMSEVLTGFVTPCVILSAFLTTDADLQNLTLLGQSALLSLCGITMAIFLGRLFVRGNDRSTTAVGRFALAFTNNGFLGIPLVYALCGQRGVFFASTTVMVSNALTWSYGVSLFQNKKSAQWKKALAQPALIAVGAGLIIYLLRITGVFHGTAFSWMSTVLSPLSKAIGYGEKMNTPLAMLVIGINLAQTGVLSALRYRRAYLLAALRQLVFPAIYLLFLLCLPRMDRDMTLTNYLEMCCPCALLTSILAVRYGDEEQQKHAAFVVVVSTLSCLATVPIMVWLGDLILHF